MYRQSINSIKVVIIPLDGVIFDLNRFRYNYYHHLCDNKNIPISKKDFYPHLSNMYDMYKDLPLDGKVDTGPLNAKIERELMQYLDYKGLKPNEGFLELLEYLHQKEIQVAVISTHRTKDAVHYLQAAKIYNKVHFIIGSDTSSMPLPSTQMLETITNHFHVHTVETLVISSFMSLNYAANELNMNIIYCEDLIPAGKLEMETSYKICKNLFEVLNTLLFDQYEESEMYSSILGMNADMSLDELNKVKDRLEQTYCNDHQILDVVNKTYSYYVTQLNQQNIKDGSVLFIPAFKEHTFIYPFTQDIKRTVLYISTEQLNWYFNEDFKDEINNLFINKHLQLSRKSFSNLSNIFEKIQFEKYSLDNMSELLTKAYFFELIIYLIRCQRYTHNINQRTNLSNITIGEIVNFIENNYGRQLTLPETAAQFGISESSLTKKIKIFTNMTFKEYLTKTRIEAAKSLLISSEKSITEIAYECGYNNSNFFGDVFKKAVGMSPSSYRKMLTKQ